MESNYMDDTEGRQESVDVHPTQGTHLLSELELFVDWGVQKQECW